MTDDEKIVEETKVGYLDSLSNLGKDKVEFTEKPTDTMKVPPLKKIEKEEYEALAMHMKLVTEIRKSMTGSAEKIETEGGEDDDIANPFATIANSAELELYKKLALKFGIQNEIDRLKESGISFRLQQGYFIEAYNVN